MKLNLKKIKDFLKFNSWHLFIKILVLFIKICPFKAALIEFVAYVRVTTYFIFKYKRHKKRRRNRILNIKRFSKHINSGLPSWLFVFKYFLQRQMDEIWGIMFHEAPDQLSKYISINNKELLEKAIASKKGAILLGMHYGPGSVRFLLSRENIAIKTLIIKEMNQDLERNYLSKVLKILSFKKFEFFKDEENYIQATKFEKKLVTALKNGTPVMMYIDFKGPYKKGIVENFLGYPMEISSFPFKLALKYDVPVLLCVFEKAQKGGYNLNFVPINNFSSPEEGVNRYIRLIESRILAYPFMWEHVLYFIGWHKQHIAQNSLL